MGAVLASMSVYCVHAVPLEPRRGHQMSWNWTYRWWSASFWVLRMEPGSSVRTANAVNPWAISLAHGPLSLFLYVLDILVSFLMCYSQVTVTCI